jgi:hypothetical protein
VHLPDDLTGVVVVVVVGAGVATGAGSFSLQRRSRFTISPLDFCMKQKCGSVGSGAAIALSAKNNETTIRLLQSIVFLSVYSIDSKDWLATELISVSQN